MTQIKKLMCWFLALAILLSTAAPGMTVTAYAETIVEETEPSSETVTVSIVAENGSITDTEGSPMNETFMVAVGEAIAFKVNSATQYAMTKVTANGESLMANAQGVYALTVTEDTQIYAENIPLESQPIQISQRQESGWAQVGTYGISISDDISVMSVQLMSVNGSNSKLTNNADGSYTATITQNGTYALRVTDINGYCAIAYIAETMVDNTVPAVVELTRITEGWAAEIEYLLRLSDVESGIANVVLKNEDGAEAVLNADGQGDYVFCIQAGELYDLYVTDNAGNTYVQKLMDGEKDTTAPQLKELHRSTSGWHNGSVTYSFTVEETQSGIAAVGYSIDGENQAVLTPDENGVYTITVAVNCTVFVTTVDRMGNSIQFVIAEDQIDMDTPVLSSPVRVQSGWCQAVQYTFTATDVTSGVASVHLIDAAQNKTLLEKGENGQYVVELAANGSYTIQVVDMAGNTAQTPFEETQIDTTAPAITEVLRAESGWTKVAAYTFRATDAQSGIMGVYVSIGGSEFEELAPAEGVYRFCVEENQPFEIRAEDIAGNLATYQGTESAIDHDAPVISAVIRSEDGWAQGVEYSFTAADTRSGIVSVTIRCGETETALTADTFGVYTFHVAENGTYTITAIDALGNTVQQSITEALIDTTAPEISELTRNTEGWQYEVTYSFEVIEQGSGVAGVVILDAEGSEIAYSQNDSLYTFTLTYNTAVCIRITDVAGNVVQQNVEESHIDRENPILDDMNRTTDGWTDAAEYTFTASDALSGIASVVWQAEGSKAEILLSDGENYTVTVTTNGTYTVIVTDMAGNTATQTVTEAFIDTTAPEVTGLSRTETDWATKTAYTFRVTDTQSGIAVVTVTIGSNDPVVLTSANGEYTFVMEENAVFEICAVDMVGNQVKQNGIEERIDTTAPAMTVPERHEEGWQFCTAYTFTANDTQSGIQRVTVTNEDGIVTELTPDGNGQYVFDVNKSGTYIVTVTDGVGNTTEYTLTDLLVDIEAPAITDILRNPAAWAQTAEFTFCVEDTQSGVESVNVYLGEEKQELHCDENGNYSFTAAANGSYKIVAIDNVGNTQTVTVDETHIDQTAPVIHSILPQSEWDAEKNTVTFTVTDESALFVVYVMDKAETRCYELTKKGDDQFELTLYANGDYTIVAMDEAGNTVSAGFTVWHIDTEKPTAPILSSSALSWTNMDVTIQAAAEDAQSGVAGYWYSSDSNTFGTGSWDYMELVDGVGTVTFTAEQDKDYFVVAEDGVGRISDVSTIHVSIDKTAPAELLVQLVTDADSGYHGVDADGTSIYKDKLSFRAAAIDPASGVCAYDYRIVDSNGNQSAWVGIEAGEEGISPVVSNLQDGVYTVYVKAYDIAGNCTEEIQLTVDGTPSNVVLENTPNADTQRYPCPDVAMLAGGKDYNGAWTNDAVIIQVSGSHAVSGIHHYEYRIDNADPSVEDTQWAEVPMVEGVAQLAAEEDTNAVYYFRAVTYADNTTQETSRTVKVQKTLPPAGSITPEQATGTNGWYTKFPGYTTTLPEQNSYMAPIQYFFCYIHDGDTENYVPVASGDDVKLHADGIWTLRVMTKDQAGNVVMGEVQTFKVDTRVPDALDVTMEGISILNGAVQTMTWNAANFHDRVVFTDFDIFRNHAVTIGVSADGGDSGMAAIYYQAVPYNEQYEKNGEWTRLDGDSVTLNADGKYHLFFKAMDVAGNTTYFSARSVVVDTKAPAGMDSDEMTIVADTSNMTVHGYYNSDITFDIHVREPMNGDAVVFSGLKNIHYRVLANGEVTQSGQLYPGSGAETVTEGRISAWDGSVVVNAQNSNYDNVVLEIIATDLAGNAKVTRATPVNVDIVAPVVAGSYDKNSTFSSYEGVSCFYGDRTLTIICAEKNFVAEQSFIYVRETDTDTVLPIQWVSDGMEHTAVIPITEDGHYEVSVSITDAAGNVTDVIAFAENTVAGDKFILDSTSPVITATHANNDAVNGKYFAADRTIVISVVERNFVSELIDVKLVVKGEDGTTKTITVPEWHSDGVTHTATITLEDNGTYQLLISGMDAVSNHATDISYVGTAATDWVIDKTITVPIFEYVADGGEYTDAIVPVITATDKNIQSLTVRLYHTSREEKNKDVTDAYLTDKTIQRKEVSDAIELSLNIFPMLQEYDGLYTMVATSVDMAGNTAESKVSFTVNRFGSVYIYDDALTELMGTSMQQMPTDIIITEMNPSEVLDGSAQVLITLDGMPVSNPKFTVEVVEGGSGWYEYRYVISKDNFAADGTYEVVLSTKDSAGNIPENTAEGYAIAFSIDNEAPALTSILGMENPIVKANSQKVTLVAMDNVQLSKLCVYINDTQVACWDNIGKYQEEYTFEIPEGLENHIRIVVTDAAGNTLNTDDDTFVPGYGFYREITVSSNFFLRYYANKPLFYGSLAGAVTTLLLFVVLMRKKKKKAQK